MNPIQILRDHTPPLVSCFAGRAALAVFAAGLASQTAKAATFLWDGDASSANGQSNVSANQSLNWLNGGNWDNLTTSAPLASWLEGDSAWLGGSTAETITLLSSEAITVGTNLRIGSGTNALGTDTSAGSITMVGDREHDVIGAAQFGIPAIGVLWGYGSRAELEGAGAVATADDVGHLGRLLS